LRLWNDLAFGFRSLTRRPAFAITALVSIAIGIAANTTVLSVFNAVLLRPLPYSDPDRLVAIWPQRVLALEEIAALRARTSSYADVAAVSPGWLMALTGTPTPRQLDADRVSGNFFDLLGQRAALGRVFGVEAETPGRDQVAVLSYDLWQTSFGGDPSVVGRTLTLNGIPYTVAAVMPRTFQEFASTADLWTPLTMDPTAAIWTGATALAYGRLRPGATPAAATAELRTLAPALQTEFRRSADWARGLAVVSLKDTLVGGVRGVLTVLLAAVAFLLLIAVANVANLFLVRTTERAHEIAVRATLGATPGAIARLLLSESLALGLTGGTLGVGLAYAGVGVLRRILPADLPRVNEISIDARVTLIAVGATLLAALLSGSAPIHQGLKALAGNVRRGRTIAGGGARVRGALVAVEVALALILTVGATLMGRTLWTLGGVDRGLRTDHLLTMRLQPPGFGSPEEASAYWRTLLAQVKTVPGVRDAATILHLPTSGRNWSADLAIEGQSLAAGASPPSAGWQSVSPGFFEVAGVPILQGRGFEASDGSTAPRVMILNSVLATRLFPGGRPIGQRIRAGFATGGAWATVVGVVGSIRHDSLNAAPAPELYVPFDQRQVGANSLVIRTAGPPTRVATAIESRIWSVRRDVPISSVETMDGLYADSLQRQRMILTLLGLFAGVGLLLSAVGTYGVVAYGVRQQLREIGVRIALGADSASIGRLIVGQGLRYGGIGVAVGVPVALLLSSLMRSMVYGVTTTDPATFAVVPAALLLVAGAASWLPARRAARVSPMETLRE
jgi:putative ABC transport system permease protein